mmetsp:Transcript_2976/g.6089  ORF Transcript_2976/g.6089 Transcript_2976/m.6089 type:complete len:88 (+) Transcript_2976:185-448(+)
MHRCTRLSHARTYKQRISAVRSRQGSWVGTRLSQWDVTFLALPILSSCVCVSVESGRLTCMHSACLSERSSESLSVCLSVCMPDYLV